MASDAVDESSKTNAAMYVLSTELTMSWWTLREWFLPRLQSDSLWSWANISHCSNPLLFCLGSSSILILSVYDTLHNAHLCTADGGLLATFVRSSDAFVVCFELFCVSQQIWSHCVFHLQNHAFFYQATETRIIGLNKVFRSARANITYNNHI